jgi:predicted amidophosphoribosyltransferase
MPCPRCQRENRPQAKFCKECGASITQSCGHCGAALSTSAKFCSECGRPASVHPGPEARYTSPDAYTSKHVAEKILTSKGALEGERKQVTVRGRSRPSIFISTPAVPWWHRASG